MSEETAEISEVVFSIPKYSIVIKTLAIQFRVMSKRHKLRIHYIN